MHEYTSGAFVFGMVTVYGIKTQQFRVVLFLRGGGRRGVTRGMPYKT